MKRFRGLLPLFRSAAELGESRSADPRRCASCVYPGSCPDGVGLLRHEPFRLESRTSLLGSSRGRRSYVITHRGYHSQPRWVESSVQTVSDGCARKFLK